MDRPPIDVYQAKADVTPMGLNAEETGSLLAYIRHLEAAIVAWAGAEPHQGNAWAARQRLQAIAATIPTKEEE